MNRRALVAGCVAAVSAGALLMRRGSARAAAGPFAVSHTPQEWRRLLTPAAFDVLRQEGTEPPWTSPLLNEHRHGVFACAGCDQAAFDSATKYDSHTGWPSFWKARVGAVAVSRDTSFGMVRDEVHCTRCGGHLGHVFDDGPRPTGLRYCMNGVALTFHPV